jgi:nucleoid-associated protein YgaU
VVRPLAPTPVAVAKDTTYTVKEGDGGFWAISEKVYGDGSHWELIQKANPQADASRLRAGQTLVIPPLSGTPVASAGPASPQQPLKPSVSGQRTYTVVKGDAGFWGIAAKEYGNGQYWTLLAKANPGVDSNALKVGQVLVVPPKPDNNVAAPVASTAQPAQANRISSGSGASQTYTVQKGDNGFWGVAQKVYGNGKYHELIASANPQVDPQKLQVGQKLIVPPLPAGGDAASRLPQAPRPATSPGSSATDGRPIFD